MMEVIINAVLMSIVVGLLLLIPAYPIMILWNTCLVPHITIAKEITWLHMWGIMILCNILFSFKTTSKQ